MIENTLILIFRSRSFNYQIIAKGPKIRNLGYVRVLMELS